MYNIYYINYSLLFCCCRLIMMLGVVLGMLLRVVGQGKMLTMHKKHQKRKTTMEPIRMQKMELTMERVSAI